MSSISDKRCAECGRLEEEHPVGRTEVANTAPTFTMRPGCRTFVPRQRPEPDAEK